MGQITTTQNLVAIKEVRHAGQQVSGRTTPNHTKSAMPLHRDTLHLTYGHKGTKSQ